MIRFGMMNPIKFAECAKNFSDKELANTARVLDRPGLTPTSEREKKMKNVILSLLWLPVLLASSVELDAFQTNASLAFINIGNPARLGSGTSSGNGYDMTAGGTNILGASDQCFYAYLQLDRDFDVKVRLASLSFSDTWAKAGLMARESLSANSRCAAVLATPSVAGVFFHSRNVVSGETSASGSFPVNHPYTWLRLRRSGDVFTGYAGIDGENWMPLGAVTLPGATNSIYLGLALTSANAGKTAVAQFRELQDVVGNPSGNLALSMEPLGPSSRRTGLAITEIMYKPEARADGRMLDFIEIYNSNPYWEDISGYKLSGDVDFTFPPGTILQGGAFAVVAKSPADLGSIHAISNVFGPYTNNLPTEGTIRLRNKENAIFLEVPYSNRPPWPVAADGTGHSLVLRRPSHGERNPEAWDISDAVGGSPGGPDGVRSGPLRSVVINEFLANSEEPLLDYVELYNQGNQPVDISGCSLSDDPRTNKFIVPANTSIPARGFLVFDQSQISFGLSSAGESIYFRSADNTRVLDAVRFEAQASGISTGRHPDGAADFQPLANRTPGAPNGGILINDVVINEIMYEPISGNSDDQYIELHNQGNTPVNLGGWRFVAGIDYTFPSNSILRADGYLVVAKNVTNLLARYFNLNPTNVGGNFDGSLAGRGERVALAKPDVAVSTNSQGSISTNITYVVVDEVTYGTGGNWGKWANGGGSSLELVDPRSNHRLAHNWSDSDETAKAPWTTVTTSGAMEQGRGPTNLIELLTLGEGEYLVDDIAVLNGSQVNMLTGGNSTLNAGIGGWLARGTHIRSQWESDTGLAGTGCLHVRASARGDTLANRALCPITMPSGIVTLRAQVRWLKGWPEFLLRLHGNHMEAFGKLQLPTNLGTPGARNSRAATNAPPAVYEVTHAPVLPAAAQPAVVTARVHDPDGVAALVVRYRVDPDSTYTSLPMSDDGAGGDAVADDGVYSATIPGQPADTLIAFQVIATDVHGAVRLFPLQDPTYSLPFECLVRFGDPILASSFGTYRQWLTQNAVNAWRNRPALSNEKIFGTFVYNNSRVIYNMAAKYSSSPFHQAQAASPVTDNAHFVIELPGDDQCLGTANWNKIHAAGNSAFDENTNQREQVGYWFARQMGLPWNYRRYVQMIINGVKKGNSAQIMEDTERAGDDFVDSRFPNDRDGNLYKLQPWFEGDDGTGLAVTVFGGGFCSLNRFSPATNSSVHFTPRYRQNWLVRAAAQTANDFTPVYDLVDAANTPTLTNSSAAHTAAMESVADMEEWMRIFAVCHAVGDWDHFGTQNSQNMYGYKPRNGKWTLMIWDMNILLGSSGSWEPGAELFNVNDNDPAMNRLYAGERGVTPNPHFRRTYLRGLKEMSGEHMRADRVEPVIDARQAALVAGGVSVSVTNVNELKAWIRAARVGISNVVAQEEATNFAVNGPSQFTVSNNLVVITGVAPFEMKSLTVNGTEYPVVWTTVRDWTVFVTVSAASNVLSLQGYDARGNPLPGFAATLDVAYTGSFPVPEGAIVFSEIQYKPVLPGAGFVELLNRAKVSFDISGWRVKGLDLTFPSGSVITNGQRLVLCENRVSFGRAYPTLNPDHEFDGKLDPDGETLTLIRIASGTGEEVVVSKIRYENRLPWPTAPSVSGTSLQVIDPSTDISRPGNWAPGAVWSNVTRTASISTATNLLVWLSATGSCFIDDITLTATNAGGTNIVINGDFEAELTGPWTVVAPYTNSYIANGIAHSGKHSLFLQRTESGGVLDVIQQRIGARVETNKVYTLSYWMLISASPVTVNLRTLPGNFLTAVATTQPVASTPGASNRFEVSLPPFEPLWLNELQAENRTGPLDNFGDREPWLEVYNAGELPLNLDGYYLADNYSSNLTQWRFPAGSTIAPREFKIVWADGEPEESVGGHLHASFRLNTGTGTVALVRLVNNTPQITDYLTYSALGQDVSYGDFPDGQPFTRGIMFLPTPAGTNISRSVNVFINEWMASNTNTLADPADGRFDDWFELYNAGTNAVDLGGYFLTDRPGSPAQYFRVPTNGHYVIPRDGFLLVWADNQSSQNSVGQPDLHVNFQLARSGESIALYAPDGRTLIDNVTFGAQIDDVSSGRYPDGRQVIAALAVPTPRAANFSTGDNTPPSIIPIGTRIAVQGQPYGFTVQRLDAEAAQTLIFSIVSGAPADAVLDASGGRFSWTPLFSFSPTTNVVTFMVEDNGVPPLSDTDTFTLISLPPPPAIVQDGTTISLSFQTIPGRTYRVDYKNSLTDPAWQPLGGDRPAGVMTLLTIADTLAGRAQRFYRIVQLD